MSRGSDVLQPASTSAAPRYRWLLVAALTIILAGMALRFAVSPVPWMRMTLARELRMGASIDETLAVIKRRGWRHGEVTTVGEVRAVTAWIRDAYGDFSGGFPSSVDVSITFVFNRQGALTRVEFSERRISL